MSGNRKALKVISIISLVLDVIVVVCGALLLFACALDPATALDVASKNPIANFSGSETVEILLGFSVVATVVGLWDVFVSIMGIRGAKDPSKMGFVTVCAGISFALAIIGVIGDIANAVFSLSDLFELAFMGIFFGVCWDVRKEGKALKAEKAVSENPEA